MSLLVHQKVSLYWFIRECVSISSSESVFLLVHQRVCLYWFIRECVSTGSSESMSLLIHQRVCLYWFIRECLYLFIRKCISTDSSQNVSLLIHHRMCLYWFIREYVSNDQSEGMSILISLHAISPQNVLSFFQNLFKSWYFPYMQSLEHYFYQCARCTFNSRLSDLLFIRVIYSSNNPAV